MKILLLGCDGQVGWELQRSLLPLGELLSLSRRDQKHGADLTRPDELADTVRRFAPDVIVNAAAYTAVDRAESQVSEAMLVNAEAPGVLAREAERLGACLLHYSTDYVFPGSGNKAWCEDDATDPLSVYGRSKLAGEEAIRASGCRHVILRTCWVYASRGGNFARTMLNLALTRDQLKVVNDQIGAPTGADLIADISALIVRDIQLGRWKDDCFGSYHLSAGGETSWCDYARYVLTLAEHAGLPLKVHAADVMGIPTEDYPVPAPRPKNSRLNTDKLSKRLAVRLPDWQLGVARMVDEILPSLNVKAV